MQPGQQKAEEVHTDFFLVGLLSCLAAAALTALLVFVIVMVRAPGILMYFTFSSGAVRDAGRQSGGEARGFGKERVFGLRGLHFSRRGRKRVFGT